MAKTRIAVVGAGLIGLSTAVCIAESISNCSVTVVADKFTPNTTSDVAAGMLIPHAHPGTPVHQQKQWFRETFDHLSVICNSSEASEAGIHLVSGWQIFKTIPDEKTPFWSDVVLGFRSMTEKELKKFPQHKFGQAFTTLKCDCPPYLIWLEKRLKENGSQVQVRHIEDLWELHSDYDIVVNCSGIGSRKLVGDLEIYPIRGQVLKVRAPWVTHFIRDGDGLTYIYPGVHNVTLGGTRQKDNWKLSPDPHTSKNIFGRCCALEPSLQKAQDIKVKVGLRPTRSTVRLQKEILVRGSEKLQVVHNYGHGGGGFSVHQGTAREATHLVKQCIAALDPSKNKAKL
ncbi:D-aspartate oxidase [Varanus komodoensis]|uniref:D-aspartate oxidase n=1 Tax=Varanus komodoensis TaxID=61221 RepID=A0A8D2J6I7_VARKO|nr:D-aspartate oxidase [Varanus komodoensis]XP_044282530.1 D-aspartate oxidase [Varanus komodoensis]XP_044282540.1 D-aspartate oxidase [Varanus komodoensis]XP_044282551.1 D-aspartate oxidase [Varanus komodoensis]KAF7253405.1 D-aspartate oxidase [Varanus komodoensis]